MNDKFASMVLAAALAAVSFSATAQSEDTLKHAATMEAIGKIADAMKTQAEALKVAVERGGNSQPVIVQAPVQKACEGFGSCLVSTIKEGFGVAKDILQVGGSYVGPVMAYRTAVKQFDFQKIESGEATKRIESNNGTLQVAFATNKDIAKAGFDALGNQQPGTVINNSGTGNNFGSGQLTYAPITDAYKVGRYCYPTTSTTGGVTTTGQTCVGG